MGGAAGKHKVKTIYVVSKDAKDDQTVQSEHDEAAGYVQTSPADQSSFEDLVKQAAAAPSSAPRVATPPSALASPSANSPAEREKPPLAVKHLPGEAAAPSLTSVADVKLSGQSCSDEFSSDSEAEAEASPRTLAKQEEARKALRKASQEARQQDSMKVMDEAEAAKQQEAMRAVREANTRSIPFGEALRDSYSRYSLDRERWIKSLGVEASGPALLKADVRTAAAYVNRQVTEFGAPASLRDPNIMDEVRKWNAKMHRDDTPKAAAAR